MSKGFMDHLIHGLSHQSAHERSKGHTGTANALAMLVFSLVLMPIPIVGVPMFCVSVYKLLAGKS